MGSIKVVDQLGRSVVLPETPERIVSLVPSLTEFLHYLSFDTEVIGITKFCVHPESWFRNKERIGGTKDLKIKRIIELNPDLIIGNKEENTERDILNLEASVPVCMTDVNSIEDAFEMMRMLGEALNRKERCEELIETTKKAFQALEGIGKGRSVLYFIWNDPLYVVGKGTFIGSMIEKMGFENACTLDRYPNLKELESPNPDYVFLSSEPFPFTMSHVKKFESLFPKSSIVMVDGEMFSWYGSRMLSSADYFTNDFVLKI